MRGYSTSDVSEIQANSLWSIAPFDAFGCEDLVFHPKTTGVEIDGRFYALDCEDDVVDGFDCESCHGGFSLLAYK